MKLRKYGLVIALFAVIALAVVGCSKEPLAATVNGKSITVAEVDKQLDQTIKASGQQSQAFEGTQGQQLKDQYRVQLLDRIIDIELIMQEAKKRGVKVTDKDINEKIKQLMKQLNIKNQKQLDEALQKSGLKEDQMKEELRKSITMTKLGDDITKNIKVTDKEVEDYFNSHKSEFATKDQIHAAHILLQKEEDANSVLQQIKSGGDFATFAKQYNPDSTKNTGGDLSWIAKDSLDATFADAAWNMQPGEISSQPVKTQFGYHIIKLIDKKTGEQKSFDEVKDKAKEKLLNQKKAEAWQKWFSDVKKKADIQKFLTPPKTEAPVVPNTGEAPGGAQGGAGAVQGGGPNQTIPKASN